MRELDDEHRPAGIERVARKRQALRSQRETQLVDVLHDRTEANAAPAHDVALSEREPAALVLGAHTAAEKLGPRAEVGDARRSDRGRRVVAELPRRHRGVAGERAEERVDPAHLRLQHQRVGVDVAWATLDGAPLGDAAHPAAGTAPVDRVGREHHAVADGLGEQGEHHAQPELAGDGEQRLELAHAPRVGSAIRGHEGIPRECDADGRDASLRDGCEVTARSPRRRARATCTAPRPPACRRHPPPAGRTPAHCSTTCLGQKTKRSMPPATVSTCPVM